MNERLTAAVKKFSMSAVASERYRGLADLCVPTWTRNAGAEAVNIDYHEDVGWHKSLVQRAKFWRRRTLEAVAARRPVVLMDVDCVVLSPIAGGFSDSHPISVARWPNINIGVLFINTLVPFPFADFFDEFVDRLQAARQTKCADQDLMRGMLHARADSVCKLDARIWNLTFGVGDGAERLKKYPNGKILHLHWSNWGRVGADRVRGRINHHYPGTFDEP